MARFIEKLPADTPPEYARYNLIKDKINEIVDTVNELILDKRLKEQADDE